LSDALTAAGAALLFGVRLWASVFVAFWLELDNPYWAGSGDRTTREIPRSPPGSALLNVKVNPMQLVMPPSAFMAPEAMIGIGGLQRQSSTGGQGPRRLGNDGGEHPLTHQASAVTLRPV
jgi:hypothetical protein